MKKYSELIKENVKLPQNLNKIPEIITSVNSLETIAKGISESLDKQTKKFEKQQEEIKKEFEKREQREREKERIQLSAPNMPIVNVFSYAPPNASQQVGDMPLKQFSAQGYTTQQGVSVPNVVVYPSGQQTSQTKLS